MTSRRIFGLGLAGLLVVLAVVVYVLMFSPVPHSATPA